ncbi:MAG: hypothetical protein WBL65_26385 [Bryobacteraceae bacterium]
MAAPSLLGLLTSQDNSQRRADGVSWSLAAILIFLATYVVLAIGRLPGFRVD